MRVGVDSDGVLYNFGDSIYRYLKSIGQENLWKSGPNVKSYWNFFEDWGWTYQQFKKMCDDGVDAGYIFRGPLRDNAKEALDEIREMGHEVIIITDRTYGSTPEKSQVATILCFDENNLNYDELHFNRDKLCVPTDIFVEDRLENYDALEAGGVLVYLINRAWNEVPGGDNRRRINDISEFPAKVAEHAERMLMV